MAPKSSIPRRRGPLCHFYHAPHSNIEEKGAEKKSDTHPEQLEAYNIYVEEKEILKRCKIESNRCAREFRSAADEVLRIRLILRVAEEVEKRADLQLRCAQVAERETVQAIATMQEKLTSCKKGAACSYYAPLVWSDGHVHPTLNPPRVCNAFHTKAEIAQFMEKQNKLINDLKEKRRIEKEKEDYENEKKQYRYHYCDYGIRIKNVGIFPDEICDIVRSYCVHREFKQNTPLQHFYDTFAHKRAVTLEYCQSCQCLHYGAPRCDLCDDDFADGRSPLYLLQTKTDNKIVVRFLHGCCADVLGLACPRDNISMYIKGDVKVYLEKEVRFLRFPSDLCLGDNHLHGSGDAMNVSIDEDNDSPGSDEHPPIDDDTNSSPINDLR